MTKTPTYDPTDARGNPRSEKVPEKGDLGGVDPAGEEGGVAPLPGDAHPGGLFIIMLLVTRIGASSAGPSPAAALAPPSLGDFDSSARRLR